MASPGYDSGVLRLRGLLDDVQQAQQRHTLNFDLVESFLLRAEHLARHFVIMTNFPPGISIDTIVSSLRRCIDLLQSTTTLVQETGLGYQAQASSESLRGRPPYVIERNHLEHLLEYGFTIASMGKMLGVSESTIRRRLRSYGMSVRQSYANLADSDLDEEVKSVKAMFPQNGYRFVMGILRSRGLRVQQHRVRESLQRVDPEGVALRWMCQIHRRRGYAVSMPLSLWHIDGNHKLIR